jgi:hypothetical protein
LIDLSVASDDAYKIDPFGGLERESFIRMDPSRPSMTSRAKVVSPIVALPNLAEMEATIRERTVRVLNELPRGGRRKRRSI